MVSEYIRKNPVLFTVCFISVKRCFSILHEPVYTIPPPPPQDFGRHIHLYHRIMCYISYQESKEMFQYTP